MVAAMVRKPSGGLGWRRGWPQVAGEMQAGACQVPLDSRGYAWDGEKSWPSWQSPTEMGKFQYR